MASQELPTRQLSADEAPLELAMAGFRCYSFITAGVEVAGIDKKNNGRVYEVYKSASRATAIGFLNAIPQNRIPEAHYVIVETPQGNVGKDIMGIFDE